MYSWACQINAHAQVSFGRRGRAASDGDGGACIPGPVAAHDWPHSKGGEMELRAVCAYD